MLIGRLTRLRIALASNWVTLMSTLNSSLKIQYLPSILLSLHFEWKGVFVLLRFATLLCIIISAILFFFVSRKVVQSWEIQHHHLRLMKRCQNAPYTEYREKRINQTVNVCLFITLEGRNYDRHSLFWCGLWRLDCVGVCNLCCKFQEEYNRERIWPILVKVINECIIAQFLWHFACLWPLLFDKNVRQHYA